MYLQDYKNMKLDIYFFLNFRTPGVHTVAVTIMAP